MATSDFPEGSNGMSDLTQKLREENEYLKTKLAQETKTKEDEIVKRKQTEDKFNALEQQMNEVKHKNKLLTNTKNVNIKYLQEQLKDSQEKVKRSEEENIVYLDMIHDAVKTIAEKDKDIEYRSNENVFLRKQNELLLMQKQKCNDQLKDSQEKVKRSEEENIVYLDMIHDAVKTIAEKDKDIEYRSNETAFLRKQTGLLLMYKHKCNERSDDCTRIIEDLNKLEQLTTQFSFRRRRAAKRLLINQIKDAVTRATSSAY